MRLLIAGLQVQVLSREQHLCRSDERSFVSRMINYTRCHKSVTTRLLELLLPPPWARAQLRQTESSSFRRAERLGSADRSLAVDLAPCEPPRRLTRCASVSPRCARGRSPCHAAARGLHKVGPSELLDTDLASDGVRVATLTIAGQIVAGAAFDPVRIAERYWEIVQLDTLAGGVSR